MPWYGYLGTNRSAKVRESTFRHGMMGVRVDDWKLIVPRQDGEEMLFNLRQDPHETKNLLFSEFDVHKTLKSKIEQKNQSLPVMSDSVAPELAEDILEGLKRLGYIK